MIQVSLSLSIIIIIIIIIILYKMLLYSMFEFYNFVQTYFLFGFW